LNVLFKCGKSYSINAIVISITRVSVNTLQKDIEQVTGFKKDERSKEATTKYSGSIST